MREGGRHNERFPRKKARHWCFPPSPRVPADRGPSAEAGHRLWPRPRDLSALRAHVALPFSLAGDELDKEEKNSGKTARDGVSEQLSGISSMSRALKQQTVLPVPS